MPNILVIGGGAREQAIVNTLMRSPQKPTIFCCASNTNPGIVHWVKEYWLGNICEVDVIAKIASRWQIDLAIVGPEAPLEKGMADALWQYNIPTIGPKKILAQLESSKSFTRNLLQRHQIAGSPEYRVFANGDVLTAAKQFLQQLGEGNYVVKADGLMSGKGVKVAGDHLASLEEAYQFCEELYSHGSAFVIEEKLIGQEFSLLCFCDGTTLVSMPLVQDHKRAFVDDEGPNTGGMGSYSDANHSLPFLTSEDIQAAQAINKAVMKALTKEHPEKFIGILYGSFMATKEGVRLIEYNARFGDPEAMNVLAILETDLLTIFQAMVNGNLSAKLVRFANLATVCKYIVPIGYPDQPQKNFLIDVTQIENPQQLYFSGVDLRDEKLYATGSRAVAVVGIAQSIFAAEEMAEKEVGRVIGALIHRPDIGTKKLVNKRIKIMRELRQCVN